MLGDRSRLVRIEERAQHVDRGRRDQWLIPSLERQQEADAEELTDREGRATYSIAYVEMKRHVWAPGYVPVNPDAGRGIPVCSR